MPFLRIQVLKWSFRDVFATEIISSFTTELSEKEIFQNFLQMNVFISTLAQDHRL